MTAALKWRLAAGLVAVFLAGVATGIFAGAYHTHHLFVGMHSGDMADRMRQHLKSELGLTPEQLGKIGPIVDRTAARLDAIRNDTGRRVAETMEQSRREIAPQLTPEQLRRLKKMQQRHLQLLRRGHLPPSPPPPP